MDTQARKCALGVPGQDAALELLQDDDERIVLLVAQYLMYRDIRQAEMIEMIRPYAIAAMLLSGAYSTKRAIPIFFDCVSVASLPSRRCRP